MSENKQLYKVVLTHTVEAVVAANSREEVDDWLRGTTPREAVEKAKSQNRSVTEDYSEEVLYEIKDKSTLIDINLAQRQVPLEGAVINCCDEIVFTDDGLLEFTWELWFDVDKYFGTNTKDDDSTWINFYTYLHNDGHVTARFFIDSNDCSEEHEWPLTLEEENILSHKMQQHCLLRNGENMLSMLDRMRDEFAGEMTNTKVACEHVADLAELQEENER